MRVLLRRWLVGVPAALFASATALRAQTAPFAGSGSSLPDSAQDARSAYRRALAAYRTRDLETARREMRSAATWWPTQQAYLEASARLAAAARDTNDAARWLVRLADLGVGGAVASDTLYRALVGAAAFDSAVARLVAATAPAVRSRVRFTVPDTMLHAEGIAFDGKTGRWFVSSVRQRKVLVVDGNGTSRAFVASGADGLGGAFGMAVDSTRRTLWVATTALARIHGFGASDSGRVGVYGYDLDSGQLRRTVWMPRDSSVLHTFGDVVVAPNGDVYASDSQAPWIVRLALGSASLERFVTHPYFRSLQGMAITPDGRAMYAADYSHGLLRIDLASRVVTPLRVARGVTALGVDGLYWKRGALIGVQNGVTPPRVVRFCLESDGLGVRNVEVLDRNPVADEPTLGAVVGDSVFYMATGQWEKFDDSGRRVKGTLLKPATVLGVWLNSDQACR